MSYSEWRGGRYRTGNRTGSRVVDLSMERADSQDEHRFVGRTFSRARRRGLRDDCRHPL